MSVARTLEQALKRARHQHAVVYEADYEHNAIAVFDENDRMTRIPNFSRRIRHMRFAVGDMVDAGSTVFQNLPGDQRVSGIPSNIIECREYQGLIALLNEFAELLLTPGQDIDEVVFGSGR